MKHGRYGSNHRHTLGSFLDVLDVHAERLPHKRALIFLHGNASQLSELDYAQVRAGIHRVASWLSQTSRRGECVLLLMPQSLEFLLIFLGCMAAGIVPVPLSLGSRPRDRRRVENVLRDSGARRVLTLDENLGSVLDTCAGAPEVAVESASASFVHSTRLDRIRAIGDANGGLAFLQYTSGSTGNPKGVMITHENLLAHAECLQQGFQLDQETIWVSWLPQFHDMGLIGGMLQPLFVGGTCVLMSPEAFVRSPRRWLQAISDYRANVSGGPNFGYDYCVRRIADDVCERLDLSSWRVAFNGAERVRASTLRSFAKKFAASRFAPRALHPCYGLAEATLFVSGGTADYLDGRRGSTPAAAEGAREPAEWSEPVSLGVCFGESAYRIVDPVTHELVPEGAVGEIWVSGPTVAAGYWGRTQVSPVQFAASLNGDTERSYLRTGDLGFQRKGELFFAGRLKEVFVYQGINYYPEDIEEQLCRSSELFRSGGTLAFAVAGPYEDEVVVVQEVLSESGCPDEQAVRAAVLRAAGDIGVPVAEVAYVAKNQLPKTTSGKMARLEAAGLYAGGGFKIFRRYDLRDAHRALEDDADQRAPGKRHPLDAEEVFRLLTPFVRHAWATPPGIDDQVWAGGLDSMSVVALHARLSNIVGAELPQVELVAGETFRTVIERAIHLANQKRLAEPGMGSAATSLAIL